MELWILSPSTFAGAFSSQWANSSTSYGDGRPQPSDGQKERIPGSHRSTAESNKATKVLSSGVDHSGDGFASVIGKGYLEKRDHGPAGQTTGLVGKKTSCKDFGRDDSSTDEHSDFEDDRSPLDMIRADRNFF